jgi:tetratricopeptide (TPR) repeat protein
MKDHDKTTRCYNKLIEFYKKNNEYKKSKENDIKISTIYFMLGVCNYHQGITCGKQEDYPAEKEYFQTALNYFKKADNINSSSETIRTMMNNCYLKLNNSRKKTANNKNKQEV